VIPSVDGVDCRHFNGYKPCFPGEDCSEGCRHPSPIGTRVLVVGLEALGAVLMTTAQLAAIKRAYPVSQIHWLTMPAALPLLENNPLIDRLHAWSDVTRLVLSEQRFDVVLNADKSDYACAFVARLACPDTRGFTLSRVGQIIPANPEAEYAYRLGLDDHLKFTVNRRTGEDILAEAWKLPYQRDPYVLRLTDDEHRMCDRLRDEWALRGKAVIAFNTGCSHLFPNKKMTVAQHVELLSRLAGRSEYALMLLGGREDAERNAEITRLSTERGIHVISTPTGDGLRRGVCYEALADIVISGDSLGMHIAIGLRKHVIAWFGLSCAPEIDLFDNGAALVPRDLACAPCWKRVCPHNLECISGIDLDAMIDAIHAHAETILSQSESAS
jgi:ADP-heptose:LPS heptosyltransferase